MRNNGRSKKGIKCVRRVAGTGAKNLTVIMSISSLRGMIHCELHSNSVTKETISNYLQNLSPKLLDHSVILLDNAPCHREVERKCSELGQTARKLPPYSPFLNAIEECFAAFKSAIKENLESRRAELFDTNEARQRGLTIANHRMNILRAAATQSLAVVTINKCAGWDNHCYSFVPDCLAKNDM